MDDKGDASRKGNEPKMKKSKRNDDGTKEVRDDKQGSNEPPDKIPSPPEVVSLMTDESLSKAMMTLNLDWGTDMKESIPLIHPLAFNGNTAEGKYRFLYTLCTDGGGNDWHLWAHKNNDDDPSSTRNGEIVFIGADH